jgi:hypothetical protein
VIRNVFGIYPAHFRKLNETMLEVFPITVYTVLLLEAISDKAMYRSSHDLVLDSISR